MFGNNLNGMFDVKSHILTEVDSCCLFIFFIGLGKLQF